MSNPDQTDKFTTIRREKSIEELNAEDEARMQQFLREAQIVEQKIMNRQRRRAA